MTNKEQAKVLRAILTNLFPKLRHFYLDTRSCQSIKLPGKAWRANYQGRHFSAKSMAKIKAIPGFLGAHEYGRPCLWDHDYHWRGTWLFFSKDAVRHFKMPVQPKIEELEFVVSLTMEDRYESITQLKKSMTVGLSLIRNVKSVTVQRW